MHSLWSRGVVFYLVTLRSRLVHARVTLYGTSSACFFGQRGVLTEEIVPPPLFASALRTQAHTLVFRFCFGVAASLTLIASCWIQASRFYHLPLFLQWAAWGIGTAAADFEISCCRRRNSTRGRVTAREEMARRFVCGQRVAA